MQHKMLLDKSWFYRNQETERLKCDKDVFKEKNDQTRCRSPQSLDTPAAAAEYLLMRTSAARAWPSMRSAREMRADTTPMRCEAACVARWKVTTLRYLCTESPPVYLPAH